MERRQGFFLTIGNAGGVLLKLNGESLGVPGKVGKVIKVKVPKDAVLKRIAKPKAIAPIEEKKGAGGIGDADIQDDGFDE